MPLNITRQDLTLVMISKTIKFDYNGGNYTQNFKIRGTNLPWTYECDVNWIGITSGATSLSLEVHPRYDFETRVGTIKVFDRFKNEIDLIVEQTGYYDLSIEMPTSIVLYESYYDENETYDVYLTVYGGPDQQIKCKKLDSYIQQVWDNSEMYNDFILRIPKKLKGTFNVKHSDYERFKNFCNKNNIDYPKSQLEKKLTIVQVTEKDVIGEMVIEYNGEPYTNYTEIPELEVSYDTPIEIKIVSTKYMVVLSKTEYQVIENSPVDLSMYPNWLDVKYVGDKLILKCTQINNFNDRYSTIKLENSTNKQQNILINIKQKSGN